MKKAYEQEIEMWNRVFEECIPVDLRNLDLKVEPMSFDGVILSNVLDVVPKDISTTVIDDLERVLKPGGYWFIKMNPYYSKEELESFEYKNAGNNIYEKDHIMRLRQATTNYWKEKFARFGKEIIYLEFEYPWQDGMNRLFV